MRIRRRHEYADGSWKVITEDVPLRVFLRRLWRRVWRAS
jgi:hypothetical protein